MDNQYQNELNEYLFSLIQDHLSTEHYFFCDNIENQNHPDSNIYYQFFDFEQDYGLGPTDYGRIKISVQYSERDDDFNSFNEENIEVIVKSKSSEEDEFYTLFCYNKNRQDDFLKTGIFSFINKEKSLIEKIIILSNMENSLQIIDKKKQIKKRI